MAPSPSLMHQDRTQHDTIYMEEEPSGNWNTAGPAWSPLEGEQHRSGGRKNWREAQKKTGYYKIEY